MKTETMEADVVRVGAVLSLRTSRTALVNVLHNSSLSGESVTKYAYMQVLKACIRFRVRVRVMRCTRFEQTVSLQSTSY